MIRFHPGEWVRVVCCGYALTGDTVLVVDFYETTKGQHEIKVYAQGKLHTFKPYEVMRIER